MLLYMLFMWCCMLHITSNFTVDNLVWFVLQKVLVQWYVMLFHNRLISRPLKQMFWLWWKWWRLGWFILVGLCTNNVTWSFFFQNWKLVAICKLVKTCARILHHKWRLYQPHTQSQTVWGLQQSGLKTNFHYVWMHQNMHRCPQI